MTIFSAWADKIEVYSLTRERRFGKTCNSEENRWHFIQTQSKKKKSFSGWLEHTENSLSYQIFAETLARPLFVLFALFYTRNLYTHLWGAVVHSHPTVLLFHVLYKKRYQNENVLTPLRQRSWRSWYGDELFLQTWGKEHKSSSV